MKQHLHLRELINRLARLDASSAWVGDLNPTQRAVLGYLSRANRFSRSPSHVAEYLGSTRGTVSQTFKSLVQKGYVTEKRSAQDKRVVSFDLTKRGIDAITHDSPLEDGLAALNSEQLDGLQQGLTSALETIIAQNDGRSFGQCHTCVHHEPRPTGGYCNLLSIALKAEETTQICHEQERR
ncbi:MarR family winged helix-turn-helix transcriptional regulator [Roseovarius sp. EL26]|uniref:MarR family winged helix-turn-helix transcriptional regulator n=1 Tax=Roseovarius sp. EL26 TaxID=2126672 RepID=UPI000EA1D08F|nr:MarR family transcriptional regulator [Roseovarius sp. EL26]